jgi:hypothetical protein
LEVQWVSESAVLLEPAVVEPAVVEPAVVEPAVVEPAVVEPAGQAEHSFRRSFRPVFCQIHRLEEPLPARDAVRGLGEGSALLALSV